MVFLIVASLCLVIGESIANAIGWTLLADQVVLVFSCFFAGRAFARILTGPRG